MKSKTMWEIKTYGAGRSALGIFTSKKKVLKALTTWADNPGNPYDIREDISKMDKVNGSEIIHIDYKSGNCVMMFVHRVLVNNGSDITLLGRD